MISHDCRSMYYISITVHILFTIVYFVFCWFFLQLMFDGSAKSRIPVEIRKMVRPLSRHFTSHVTQGVSNLASLGITADILRCIWIHWMYGYFVFGLGSYLDTFKTCSALLKKALRPLLQSASTPQTHARPVYAELVSSLSDVTMRSELVLHWTSVAQFYILTHTHTHIYHLSIT